MVVNGAVNASSLVTLATGFQLNTVSAVAWRNMVAVGTLEGIRVTPVAKFGSGYRSLQAQKWFRDSYKGVESAREELAKRGVVIDPNMHVNVAVPGQSSHGTGTRADTFFNGHSPEPSHIAFAARFGWVREFGTADENHFAHDGHTYTISTADKVRCVAAYLNERKLGQTTTSEKDGKRDTSGKVQEHYAWLLQAAGIKDRLYKVPPFVHDGKWGDRTAWLETHYWNQIHKG
jgi:hypothetical protein